MESTNTFTTRSNAKRNAIKAGVPVEQVEIVAHGKGDDVRFGWKQTTTTVQRDTSLLSDVFPKPKTTVQRKPKVQAKVFADADGNGKGARVLVQPQEREERNGIKRPGAGGKCAAVWNFCDAFLKKNGTAPTLADARDWAERTGANANNAVIETYQWKRFMGYGKKAA